MRYDKARQLAIEAGKKLKPFCEKLHIAGSIRRFSGSPHHQTSEVKDIELICIPRYIDKSMIDLFGGSTKTKVISENFIAAVKSLGKSTKGSPDGRYMQIDHRGIKIDLFLPEPVDFYRQYCIRTGSTGYIQHVITPQWVRLGWCGTDQGLRRISDCKETTGMSSKKTWTIVNLNAERPPVWESEEHFISWLKLPYLYPHNRSF